MSGKKPSPVQHIHLSAPDLQCLMEPLLLVAASSTSATTINTNGGNKTQSTGITGPIGVRGRHFDYESDGTSEGASSDDENHDDNDENNRKATPSPASTAFTTGNINYGFSIDGGAAPGIVLPIIIPVHDDDDGDAHQHVKQYKCMNLPTAILSNTDSATLTEATYSNSEDVSTSPTPTIARLYLDVGHTIKTKPVIVLLLRSGRFAGGVFINHNCVEHRVCTRYTVRKGQGGSQSARDNSKGKAKSMGAQLRRAGETALREDVRQTLESWERWMREAAIVFLSCPNTMKKALHEDCSKILPRGDVRLRRIPLSFKRPSYDAVCFVHKTLTFATVRTMTDGEVQTLLVATSVAAQTKQESEATGTLTPRATGNHVPDENPSSLLATKNDNVEDAPPPVVTPFTPLHYAAADADLNTLVEALELHGMSIDVRAGEKEMTPLHLASLSKDEESAKCVKALLITGHANPCVIDSHGRPPVYLASTDRIKEAFRIARAELGEDYCAWTEKAKVGPALTKEMIQAKKEKEAEKKRRQRARQKEKKLAQKKAAEEEEIMQREEEELKKQEEEAKRARAGLAAKKASNACDFCQKMCRRNQMFFRLEFSYCSTDCVKRHQRELMATAASRRFNAGV